MAAPNGKTHLQVRQNRSLICSMRAIQIAVAHAVTRSPKMASGAIAVLLGSTAKKIALGSTEQTEYDSLAKLTTQAVKYFCPSCVKDSGEDGDVDTKLGRVDAKLDRIIEGLKSRQKDEKELEKKIESIVEKKVRDVAQEKEERKEGKRKEEGRKEVVVH